VTATYAAVADTYVKSINPSSSFGDNPTMRVSRAQNRGLLRFDLSTLPAESTITSAELRLYSLSSPTGGQLEVHPGSNDWSEATTWNDQPAWDATVVATSATTPVADTWQSVPLPANAVGTPVASLGLSFSLSGIAPRFATREDPAHRPQLVVTYTTSQPSPALTDTSSPTSSDTSSPTADATSTETGGSPAGDIVLGAVGDTNRDGNSSTTSGSGLNAASIKAAGVDAWVHLGDHQYEYGDCSILVNEFDKAGWGAVWNKALNVSGPTHDWSSVTDLGNVTSHQAGTCAGQTSGKSLDDAMTGQNLGPDANYVVDLGAWRLVSLSSGLWRYNKVAATAATAWLDITLAEAKAAGDHVVVAWHEPYWTSDSVQHTRTLAVKPWVDLLDKYDVPLLLNGHQHGYARFYSQSADGSRDDATGTQEFIVGTGGIGFYSWTSTAANVATQQTGTYGWLKLHLHPDGHYEWDFVGTSGGSYTDSGLR
jgi:hypothetical protein